MKCLQGIQFFIGGQTKVDACNPLRRFGEVLDHGASGKRPQRTVSRGAIARPAGAGTVPAVNRRFHCQRMRHAAHVEIVIQVVEAILIFDNHCELPHQQRILEIDREVGVEFGDKQRIVIRERCDKRRCQTEIIRWPMAGRAGTAVAVEGFVQENLFALFHQCRFGGRRGWSFAGG